MKGPTFLSFTYGDLIEDFGENGCIVVGCVREGYEVALTAPKQAFPIQVVTDENGDKIYHQSYKDAVDAANTLIAEINCGEVTFPDQQVPVYIEYTGAERAKNFEQELDAQIEDYTNREHDDV